MDTKRFAAYAVGAVFVGWGQAAHADVTIVSLVNVTGRPPHPGPGPDPGREPIFPQNVKTYYKGANARTEVSGGPITIYKGAEGKAYRLDPRRKTYFVMNFSQAEQGHRGGWMKPEVALKLTASGEKRMLAGASAQKYTLHGSVKMSRPPDGGGPEGFGGPPPPDGGGMDGPPPPREGGPGGQRPPPPNMTLTGEIWLSAGVKLPPDAHATTLPSVETAAMGIRPLLMSLTTALNKTKRLPLRTRITVTRSAPPPHPGMQDGRNQSAPPAMVTTMTAKSISSAAVPMSLFAVPKGYTKVNRPGPPMDGRRGPGMGGPPPPGE